MDIVFGAVTASQRAEDLETKEAAQFAAAVDLGPNGKGEAMHLESVSRA
jgi:hypothetical protein